MRNNGKGGEWKCHVESHPQYPAGRGLVEGLMVSHELMHIVSVNDLSVDDLLLVLH